VVDFQLASFCTFLTPPASYCSLSRIADSLKLRYSFSCDFSAKLAGSAKPLNWLPRANIQTRLSMAFDLPVKVGAARGKCQEAAYDPTPEYTTRSRPSPRSESEWTTRFPAPGRRRAEWNTGLLAPSAYRVSGPRVVSSARCYWSLYGLNRRMGLAMEARGLGSSRRERPPNPTAPHQGLEAT